MSKPPAIAAHGLHKSYRLGKSHLHVLRGVNLRVESGEFVAVVGASGSGKSTLLHLVGLLDRPDEGQVELDGVDIAGLSAGRRNRLRCGDIGFVFQFYHLMGELNVLENVLLPAMVASPLAGWPVGRQAARERAAELLGQMGLAKRLKHRPKELSGGERQRVAIARALVNSPGIVLADEPTGNLDSKTGRQIMDVLERLNRDAGQTLLMVTHDANLAKRADCIVHLADGRIE